MKSPVAGFESRHHSPLCEELVLATAFTMSTVNDANPEESSPLLHDIENTGAKKPGQLINISPLAVGSRFIGAT